jgi:hypothetical protein
MSCSRISEQLGAYLDSELPAEQAKAVRSHLADCARCEAELAALTELSEQLEHCAAAGSRVRAPAEIWSAIERRLDNPSDSPPLPVYSKPGRISRFLHRPMALAASLAVFLGIGVLFTTVLDRASPVAHAATIDYRILMDGVASDVRGCIDRFLAHYKAEPIHRTAAHAETPHLSFDLPDALPAGYRFAQAYSFKLGHSKAIAATYENESTPLFLIFHPAGDNVASAQGTSCKIGDLRAGQIEAGPWTLIHVMDDTTCHCVLSTLDGADLEAVVWAVSPLLEAGANHGIYCH